MAPKSTLYDRTVAWLKNRRVIVVLGLLFSAVLAVSQLVAGLSWVERLFFVEHISVKVEVELRPYHLIAGPIGDSQRLELVEGSLDDLGQIAEHISDLSRTLIFGTEQSKTVTLLIDGDTLKASEPIVGYLNLSPQAGPVQVSRLRKEISPDAPLDLRMLSEGSLYFDSERKRVALSVEDPAGRSASEFVEVFRRDGGFSFDAASFVNEKLIQFREKPLRLLIDSFKGVGPAGSNPDTIAARLENLLRTTLAAQPRIGVSSESLDDLNRVADRIRPLPGGRGKEELLDQHSVDLIMAGTVTVQAENKLRWF